NKEMTLNLNGQTIFVASSTVGQPALWIGGKLNIIGPGIILAVGDIYFEPNIPVGMTDPIFIMSVEGETLLQPGGDFYGSIAGSVEVQLQPGSSISYPAGGFDESELNFLIGVQMLIFHIASWDVTLLSPEEV
ncbi:MAG TPA: pilus assembly protein PilZ, partial [Dehalococcoidia bacterium]|nr:pilus assembly protein PilZ [Dehalococcoidia bacterium]